MGNANQGFMTCGRVFVLTLSCIMMKNGQTYFKKCLTIFITLHEKVNNHSTFLAYKTVFQCTKWVLNRDTCIEQYVAEELNMCVIYCLCTLRKFSCFQTFSNSFSSILAVESFICFSPAIIMKRLFCDSKYLWFIKNIYRQCEIYLCHWKSI